MPKVNSYEEIVQVSRLMVRYGACPSIDLWPMIETPRGVLNAHAIATHHQVQCLVLGTSDLTKVNHPYLLHILYIRRRVGIGLYYIT